MPKVFAGFIDVVRSEITKAALKVFSEKGYHEAKMDDIAAVAKLSKPTLYEYVEGKEELLKIISEAAQKGTEDSLAPQNGDPMETLEGNYRAMVKARGTLHLGFEITSMSSHDKAIRKLSRDVYEAKLRALTAFLRNHQSRGTIGKGVDPTRAAQLLAAIYTDISTQLIMGYDEADIHEHWLTAVSMILGRRADANTAPKERSR